MVGEGKGKREEEEKEGNVTFEGKQIRNKIQIGIPGVFDKLDNKSGVGCCFLSLSCWDGNEQM